jgi:hypothetical protein
MEMSTHFEDFFHIREKRELNPPSYFDLIMFIYEALNKDGIEWKYVHYYKTRKRDHSEMMFYFYDEVSRMHFILVNEPMADLFGHKNYRLFFSDMDYTNESYLDREFWGGWDTAEEFGKKFDEILSKFRESKKG